MSELTAPFWYTLRAAFVHVYTGVGMVLALLAANAVVEQATGWVIAYMALAMLIDGTDGPLARRWDVRRWTPHFDGRKLDDLVDFLTYTFVPLFFAHQYALVEGVWTYTLYAALLASAYGFCHTAAKTDEGYFTGFPSYWNGVVLYLFWLQWPAWAAGLVILAFALMTFLPLRFISLNQTVPLRRTNRALVILWGVLLFFLLRDYASPDARLVLLSLAYPVFYFGASMYLHMREP